MPVEKESKLGAYIDALKAYAPTVRERFRAWVEACRAEPVLIWQTPAVRYVTYLAGGLIAVWAVTAFAGLFAPEKAIPRAKTADFHVVCTNRACSHHFVINRKFGFDDFPVPCPRCEQKTGQRAVRCVGGPRDGAWVAATLTADGELVGEACSIPPDPTE